MHVSKFSNDCYMTTNCAWKCIKVISKPIRLLVILYLRNPYALIKQCTIQMHFMVLN